MRIQSGICIELNDDRSIFLVKDGQFVTGTPVGDTSIGEEAMFYAFVKKPMIRWQPIIAPVIAAAAALALFLSVLVFPTEEAFGYVQIQINPGIELGINEQHEVVSIRELNSDGKKLIHQLDEWEDRPFSDILNRVIDLAVTEKTEDITITAVEEDGRELKDSVKKVILAVSSDAEIGKVEVYLKAATKKQWRQSKEEHVPVGQLIEKAETLKTEKQPAVEKADPETKKVPVPKENDETSEQKTPNANKETNNNQETNENKPQKENKPTSGKGAPPPAADKKKENQSVESKQPQKTPEQNNQVEKPSNQPKNLVPEKKKESVNPPLKTEPKQKNESKAKPEPKQKPAEKIEKRGPENKQQENRKAPGQQKEKNSSSTNHKPENKKKSESLPGQLKKQNQNPGKKQLNGFDAKGNGNPAKEDNKKQNQGKE